MEDCIKPENVRLLTQLVLPGFVIVYLRGRLLPNRTVPLQEAIIGYIAISFLHQALLAPFDAWLNSPRLTDPAHGLILVATTLLLPALLGVIMGLDGQHGWSRSAFQKLGIHMSHPVDTAWAWRLGQEECWVLAVLKDGAQWAGHFGLTSFVSTDPDERDIYIDEVYLRDPHTGDWTPKGSGVWIAHGELQSLEFWPEFRRSDTTSPGAEPVTIMSGPPNQGSGGLVAR